MVDMKPAGSMVDALGIEVTVDDGDLPAGALLIVKVIRPDGNVALRHAWSDGMSWIERRGMIEVARDLERCEQRGPFRESDDDT